MTQLRNYLLLAIGAGSIFISSCKEEEEKETITPVLTVSIDECTFFAKAEEQTFTVTSDAEWSIDYDEWLNVFPTSGEAGTKEITLSASDNEQGNGTRVGVITVQAGNAQKTITVRQTDEDLALSLSELAFKDTETSISKTFNVTSTTAWTADTEDWLKLSPKKGKVGTTKVTATIGINTEEGVRNGNINIKIDNSFYAKSINVTQDKFNYFKVSDDNVSLSDLGKYRRITLTTSSAWTITTDKSWVHANPESGQAGVFKIKVSADENNEGVERDGNLTITASSSKNLSITQGKKGDYYNDGHLHVLQTHTDGTGIRVIIVGDGFDREDHKKNGLYETHCKNLYEDFKKNPVIKDFIGYFDFYGYVAESIERGVSEASNPTKNRFGSTGLPEADHRWYEVRDLVAGLPEVDDIKNASIIFAANGPFTGYALWFGEDTGYAMRPIGESNPPYWMAHEFVGHGFGHLADEYGSGDASDQDREWLRGEHKNGWKLNLEATDDPNEVLWKEFLKLPDYVEAGMGIFAGGDYRGAGIWRAEERTVMRGWLDEYNTKGAHYSAQARWILYDRIMRRAGKEELRTFEKFLEYDRATNLNK